MRTTPPDAPLISASRIRDGRGRLVWLLDIRCPHCQKTHTHGGGTERATVSQYLGHRAAHCASSVGYNLTDPDKVLP